MKPDNNITPVIFNSDREYDPNKHCGVINSETGKACTRSLTCKTHSLSLRRAVPGRKKNFDELLSDHRAAKESLIKAQQLQAGLSKNVCPSPPKLIPAKIFKGQTDFFEPLFHKTRDVRHAVTFTKMVEASIDSSDEDIFQNYAGKNGIKPYRFEPKRRRLNVDQHGSHKPVRPASFSSSFNSIPKSLSPGPPPLLKQCKTVGSHSSSLSSPNKVVSMPNLLSPKESANNSSPAGSSISDVTSPDHTSFYQSFPHSASNRETAESIYKSRHPKPAAMCTFGGRRVGQGLFVFSRKQDILRAICKPLTTDRSNRCPPSKKLCLESRLPPVPDVSNSDDPSDPYSFTCGEQVSGNKSSTLVNNGLCSPPGLSPTECHNLKVKQSPTLIAKSKDNESNSSVDSASSIKQNVAKRKRSSCVQITDSNNTNHAITVSIPESSVNMAAIPNPSLNPSAFIRNHLDGTAAINSVKDLNIVVTNMDVINGEVEQVQNSVTDSWTKIETNNSDSISKMNKKSESSAKIFSKTKNRKPPILTKAQPNRNATSTISTPFIPVSTTISSFSSLTNGINISSSSPVIQNTVSNSLPTSNKFFTKHRIISPANSSHLNITHKGVNKFTTNSKHILNSNLSNKEVQQKSKISAKPAQFINLTQALSSDRNSAIGCDTTTSPVQTIAYQQVFTNQVIGFSHLQLQTSGQKPNISPTINITSPQLKIPFLRTSTTPSVPSQQNRPLFITTDKTLKQSDVQGSPSLPS
ncbi:Ataxin-7-like protein 1 [Nymphon striatum]|nr:Ataxin-7-like protein 1 [Nymphon striatum]